MNKYNENEYIERKIEELLKKLIFKRERDIPCVS